jgi:hypothetical protein
MQCTAALNAFAGDDEIQRFVSKSPLHEGRRNRVNRSSDVYLLPTAKENPVRRRFGRHRVSPQHISQFITIEKRHACFKLVQDSYNATQRQVEFSGD